jgi:hypothetical protein
MNQFKSVWKTNLDTFTNEVDKLVKEGFAVVQIFKDDSAYIAFLVKYEDD